MKIMLRAAMAMICLVSVSTTVYSMGAKPEIPTTTEVPAEFSSLAADMMDFALESFGSSMSGGVDIQALLASFMKSDYIPLGEHNGTTVSVAPCFTGGIMGLTFRLTFDHAVVEVPVDPADPSGAKKMVGTIASGVLDISAGIELINMNVNTLVVNIDTPETLVLEDANQTQIEFQNVKCGFNLSSMAPVSGDAYKVSGAVVVEGYEIDIETIADLIDLMSKAGM